MRLVVRFAGQALVFVAMLISSFVALFCVLHAINAGTLSLSSWPLAQKSYHKSQGNKVAGSAWDGVGFNDTKGLLWFVHISDLHISKFRSPERAIDLEKFCVFLKENVSPRVVVVTGDLTDGKTPEGIGSRQFKEEWETYRSVWKDHCQVKPDSKRPEDTLWLDIRGNHDTFNVHSDMDENNFFRVYGAQGPSRRRSYQKSVVVDDMWNFDFVGIDTTLTPGPKRPFNFFGSLTEHQFSEVDQILSASKNSSGLVTFGHYPLSTVISPNPGIKSLVGRSGADAYLSGHLHDLVFGLGRDLYAKQSEGYLDIELGDWKDNRHFRLMAFDHGHLSFIDLIYEKEQPPTQAVLITNPLDARFVYGSKMASAFTSMARSTHVRALVFTPPGSEEPKVEALIDSVGPALEMKRAEEGKPMFVGAWDPKKYNDSKLHTLNVTVTTKSGSTSHVMQFATDLSGLESLEDFGVVQRAILMSNIALLLQAGMAIIMASVVIPMCVLRLLHRLALEGKFNRPRRPRNVVGRVFYRLFKALWIVSNTNQLFYSVVIYFIMVAFGPWGLGYFLDDGLGVVFAWGMIVNGTLLPTYTTLIYSYWFMAPYWFIMLAGVTWIVGNKYEDMSELGVSMPAPSFCAYLCRHLWFILVMLIQGFHSVEFYIAYGFLALFSIPGIFRLVAFYFFWSRAVSLQYKDFAESGINQVWSNTNRGVAVLESSLSSETTETNSGPLNHTESPKDR